MAGNDDKENIGVLCEKTKKLDISDDNDVEENFFYVLGGITQSTCDYIYIKKQNKWYPLPPCQRAYFNCCVINKKMYLIGGRINGIPEDSLSVFANKMWTNVPLKLIEKRSESGIAVINSKIFIVGGYAKAERLIEVYDTEKNSRSLLKPKLQQARYGHNVIALDNVIYALGGHKLRRYFSSMEKLNVVQNDSKWLSCTGMHRRRAYFGAVALLPYIYVFGGCGGVTNSNEITRLDSAERYDTRSDNWTLLASMPTARSNIAAIKWGKKILIIGGIDINKRKLRDILVYDPETNSYKLFHTKLPEWRFAHSSASE